MAHAKPIVASHIGGIPELVRHGQTGLLFESKNTQQLSSQIKTMLNDPDLRKKFGNEALKIAEAEYSLERHGAAVLSLYENLAASTGVSRGSPLKRVRDPHDTPICDYLLQDRE
jgi:glycosyltransferase involved in cell wall biosynthesis